MDGKSITTHGVWAVALVATFFVGARWNSNLPGDDRSSDLSANDSGVGPLVSSRSDRASSRSTGPTSSNRSGAIAGESTIDSLYNLTPFSPGNLEALTAEALSHPNQVKRRLAFSRILSQMTAENAGTIRDQLLAAGAGGSEWRDFNYAWGALAGEEAFNEALTADKKDLKSLLSGWADVDPAGAIAMLEKLPPELADKKRELEDGIVAGLADRDRDEATRYVASLVEGGREDAARLMQTVANEVIRKDGELAATAWVDGMEDGKLKGAAMNEVAERYVRRDPAAAAVWVEQFADKEFAARAVSEVGRRWAEREPLAAVTWLDELPEGPGQKSGLNRAFGDWEDKDPKAAGEYLMSMPESPKRDSAISGFARGYAWQDPEIALQWTGAIKDPNLRTESLKRVGYAYFRRKPDEARAWLAQSGLPADVQAEIQSPRRRR